MLKYKANELHMDPVIVNLDLIINYHKTALLSHPYQCTYALLLNYPCEIAEL